ncbi:MAG: c-type cytochrome, partial [Proteobacteria bacterium]
MLRISWHLGRPARPQLADHREQCSACHQTQPQQQGGGRHPAIQEIPEREERRPDEDRAREPAQQRKWDVVAQIAPVLFGLTGE